MDPLTHDEMYKKYLQYKYGPNTFPLIKILTAIIGYLLIVIIVTMQIFTFLKIEPTVVEILPKPEVERKELSAPVVMPAR